MRAANLLPRFLAYAVDITVLFLLWVFVLCNFQDTVPHIHLSSFVNFVLFSNEQLQNAGNLAGFFNDLLVRLGAVLLYTMIGGILYSTICESSPLAATPGKLLFGLRVSKSNGKRLSMPRAAFRNALKLLYYFPALLAFYLPADGDNVSHHTVVIAALYLSLLLYVCGHLLVLATEHRQTFHDALSRSCVLQARNVRAFYFVCTGICAGLFVISVWFYAYDAETLMRVLNNPYSAFKNSFSAAGKGGEGPVTDDAMMLQPTFVERLFPRRQIAGHIIVDGQRRDFRDGALLWQPEAALLEIAFFPLRLSPEQRKQFIERRSFVPVRGDAVGPYVVLGLLFQPGAQTNELQNLVDYGLTLYHFDITKSISFDITRDTAGWQQRGEVKALNGAFQGKNIIAGRIEGAERLALVANRITEISWQLWFRDKL